MVWLMKFKIFMTGPLQKKFCLLCVLNSQYFFSTDLSVTIIRHKNTNTHTYAGRLFFSTSLLACFYNSIVLLKELGLKYV